MTDELNVSFDDIDLNYPRLTKGVYELLIKEVTRATGDNDYLKVAVETTAQCTTTDGQSHPPGFKTSTIVGLTPFEGQTMADVNKNLAALVRSAGLTGLNKETFLQNPAILNGKVAPCRVTVFKSKKDDSEKNGFNFFVKK